MGRKVLWDVSERWLPVVRRLEEAHAWEPVYWLGNAESEETVREDFPDVIFHESMKARLGVPPVSFSEVEGHHLDAEVLETYEAHTDMIFRIMDRMDPGYSFCHDERVRLYHTLLGFWLEILDSCDVDTVVFRKSPLQVHEFVIYAICVENGIDTPIISSTKLPELWFVRGDVYETNDRLVEASHEDPSDDDAVEVSERSLQYVRGVEDGDHSMMNYQKDDATISGKLFNFDRYPRYLSKLPQPAGTNYKIRGRPVEESEVTWARYFLQKIRAYRRKMRLKREYSALSTSPDLSSDFVYVPLHYQPEKSTAPEGRFFCRQILMVELLSRATPDDWQTYVKEHPKQFYFDKLGERSRHAYDYRDLDDIEGVSLVELSCRSADLIRNSRAVANVTGTAGWEAVVRGTPSLVFGNAWYQACPGVFRTETKSEVADAIDAIRSGVTIDRRGVLSFVRSVEEAGFRIPGGEARLDSGMDSDSETIRTLSDALVEFVDLKR